ncbi:MAG: hypothetical protein ACE361_21600 [Aureliella sp.]
MLSDQFGCDYDFPVAGATCVRKVRSQIAIAENEEMTKAGCEGPEESAKSDGHVVAVWPTDQAQSYVRYIRRELRIDANGSFQNANFIGCTRGFEENGSKYW